MSSKAEDINKICKNKVLVYPAGSPVAAIQVAADGKWIKYVMRKAPGRTFILDTADVKDRILDDSDVGDIVISLGKDITESVNESDEKASGAGCVVRSTEISHPIRIAAYETLRNTVTGAAELIAQGGIDAVAGGYGAPDIPSVLTAFTAPDGKSQVIIKANGKEYGFYDTGRVDARGRNVYAPAGNPLYLYGIMLTENDGDWDSKMRSLAGLELPEPEEEDGK